MTPATLEHAWQILGDRLRQERLVTPKRGMWENVCPKGEGPYTTTPASKMTC
jgi:hypothetical protein